MNVVEYNKQYSDLNCTAEEVVTKWCESSGVPQKIHNQSASLCPATLLVYVKNENHVLRQFRQI